MDNENLLAIIGSLITEEPFSDKDIFTFGNVLRSIIRHLPNKSTTMMMLSEATNEDFLKAIYKAREVESYD